MDWNEVRQQAVAIAREAGAVLRAGFHERKQIARKSSEVDLVTEYDERCERLIAERLQGAFPDHGLVGEEGGRSAGSSGLKWYVDPLDGTNNFASGFPHFAVSMALYEDDDPLVAVTYDPLKDECFTATAGGGAFLNDSRLQTSRTERLVDSLLATGFPYDRATARHDNVDQLRAFLKASRGVRRVGSATLDLAWLAAARFDGFWEFKLGTWDVAAGILLVREAGGTVTAMDGGPIRLHDKLGLVASNGPIHRQMLEVLARVPVPDEEPPGHASPL